MATSRIAADNRFSVRNVLGVELIRLGHQLLCLFLHCFLRKNGWKECNLPSRRSSLWLQRKERRLQEVDSMMRPRILRFLDTESRKTMMKVADFDEDEVRLKGRREGGRKGTLSETLPKRDVLHKKHKQCFLTFPAWLPEEERDSLLCSLLGAFPFQPKSESPTLSVPQGELRIMLRKVSGTDSCDCPTRKRTHRSNKARAQTLKPFG